MVTILQTSLWPRADLSNHCALARISEFDDKSSIIRVFKSWVLLKITNGKQSSNATVHCERSFWKHKKKLTLLNLEKRVHQSFKVTVVNWTHLFKEGHLNLRVQISAGKSVLSKQINQNLFEPFLGDLLREMRCREGTPERNEPPLCRHAVIWVISMRNTLKCACEIQEINLCYKFK